MTREWAVRDRLCANNYGMAAAYYGDNSTPPPRDGRTTRLRDGDTGSTDWLRDTARREYRYNRRGW